MIDNNAFDLDLNMITKAEIGGQIIEQTLDTLNSCSSRNDGLNSGCGRSSSMSSDISASYDFNKDVLSAAYSTKGALVNNGI